MMSQAASVERSEGALNSVAVARQWTQRRLQPLVNSQKISRGLFLLIEAVAELESCGLECPLPFAEAIGKFHPYLNWDRTPTHEATIRESSTLGGDTRHPELRSEEHT